jgi:hypothetical protein
MLLSLHPTFHFISPPPQCQSSVKLTRNLREREKMEKSRHYSRRCHSPITHQSAPMPPPSLLLSYNWLVVLMMMFLSVAQVGATAGLRVGSVYGSSGSVSPFLSVTHSGSHLCVGSSESIGWSLAVQCYAIDPAGNLLPATPQRQATYLLSHSAISAMAITQDDSAVVLAITAYPIVIRFLRNPLHGAFRSSTADEFLTLPAGLTSASAVLPLQVWSTLVGFSTGQVYLAQHSPPDGSVAITPASWKLVYSGVLAVSGLLLSSTNDTVLVCTPRQVLVWCLWSGTGTYGGSAVFTTAVPGQTLLGVVEGVSTSMNMVFFVAATNGAYTFLLDRAVCNLTMLSELPVPPGFGIRAPLYFPSTSGGLATLVSPFAFYRTQGWVWAVNETTNMLLTNPAPTVTQSATPQEGVYPASGMAKLGDILYLAGTGGELHWYQRSTTGLFVNQLMFLNPKTICVGFAGIAGRVTLSVTQPDAVMYAVPATGDDVHTYSMGLSTLLANQTLQPGETFMRFMANSSRDALGKYHLLVRDHKTHKHAVSARLCCDACV